MAFSCGKSWKCFASDDAELTINDLGSNEYFRLSLIQHKSDIVNQFTRNSIKLWRKYHLNEDDFIDLKDTEFSSFERNGKSININIFINKIEEDIISKQGTGTGLLEYDIKSKIKNTSNELKIDSDIIEILFEGLILDKDNLEQRNLHKTNQEYRANKRPFFRVNDKIIASKSMVLESIGLLKMDITYGNLPKEWVEFYPKKLLVKRLMENGLRIKYQKSLKQ